MGLAKKLFRLIDLVWGITLLVVHTKVFRAFRKRRRRGNGNRESRAWLQPQEQSEKMRPTPGN